ncbi:MAG: hypothetical protein K9K38_04005 [Rhodoferax sp.]|nr:hypothetical protein [Rhodoferax sp.]
MSFTTIVCALLSEWITFLLGTVPLRGRLTFVELHCGCLMSQEGWVTQVISIVGHEKHWTTYYKFLERRSVKTQALASQLMRLVMRVFPSEVTMEFLRNNCHSCANVEVKLNAHGKSTSCRRTAAHMVRTPCALSRYRREF